MLTESRQHLAEVTVRASTTVAVDVGVVARDETTRWTRASRYGRIAAEHGHARAILGAAKGNHVLADVGSNQFAVVRTAVGENVLDEVIAELVTSDCVSC